MAAATKSFLAVRFMGPDPEERMLGCGVELPFKQPSGSHGRMFQVLSFLTLTFSMFVRDEARRAGTMLAGGVSHRNGKTSITEA